MFLCENVALLQRNLVTVSVQHDSYCKIRTINISGYGTIHHEIIDKIDIKEPYLKNILRQGQEYCSIRMLD